jgi:dynein heavy chain
MNTVLDDNKKLCLMSGEIIAMTDVMSMMFEPMDLLVASPATVSRCGMIYLEPEQLGWKPLFLSWLEKYKINGKFRSTDPESELVRLDLTESDASYITCLVNWLIEPGLCFVRKEGSEMSPTVDSNLVMSFLNIFEALLVKAFVKYASQVASDGSGEITLDAKQLKQRTQDIECCFFFSFVWSVGISGTASSQNKFSIFIENFIANVDCIQSDYPNVWNALMIRSWNKPDFSQGLFKGHFLYSMPMKYNFFECIYIPEESKWKFWTDLLPAFKIPADAKYSSIVVPNSYTAQFSYMLELLVPNKKHVLMCGPTGTGKSVYVYNTITTGLPQDKFKPLCLGFSAKTSANMTQDIIDGKLDKRRKGVYGPPMGQQSIIFIDDLNMPEVETYGAQPPIELIRQLIDNGGWYDLKEKSWRTIIDTSIVSAMGPPGGGRNYITPRLLRHFNLLCFAEFDDNTLKRIFSTIIQWHFTTYSFMSDVRTLSESIVDATLDTYKAAMSNLLPTPQKSHYTFNLRDFSRVIQGVLLVKPSESFDKSSLIRLWTHEALRVFGDRLVNDSDKEWFHSHLMSVCTNKFGASFNDVFKHLDTAGNKTITPNELRCLIFGDYMTNDEPKPYNEIKSMPELQIRIEEYLSEYNQQSRKPMDLVMFGFAIEHVSKISRIFRMPGGNALLVGVGGSGRQSVTRLAAFMAGCDVFQIGFLLQI